MIFLELEDLLRVAQRTLGIAPVARDHGLLESALARSQATAFGEDPPIIYFLERFNHRASTEQVSVRRAW